MQDTKTTAGASGPRGSKPDRAAVRKLLDSVRAQGRASLTAPEGKQVCDAYGIPVPQEAVAATAAEAAKCASAMGFPVALKIVSPDILHKTEAGGVLLDLKSAEAVAAGYERIVANARQYQADAKILGVQVQQMLTGGQEVIIGAVTDGGLGSVGGAVAASLVIGVAEVMTVAYVASSWRDAVAFGIIIVALMLRPSGLFGSKVSEKV